MDKPFYLRIRNYILTNGYKMNIVADKAGIERKKFYRMMSGRQIVDMDSFVNIAAAVNAHCVDFFEEAV